jgi:hypothetical protein
MSRSASEACRPAAGIADVGEPVPGIGAVEILLDRLLHNRPEIAVLSLEPPLIFGEKPIEMHERARGRGPCARDVRNRLHSHTAIRAGWRLKRTLHDVEKVDGRDKAFEGPIGIIWIGE